MRKNIIVQYFRLDYLPKRLFFLLRFWIIITPSSIDIARSGYIIRARRCH